MGDARKKLLEELASLEHEQWMSWAKDVEREVSKERRKRWHQFYVPYSQLPDEVKGPDLIWAKRALGVMLKWRHADTDPPPRDGSIVIVEEREGVYALVQWKPVEFFDEGGWFLVSDVVGSAFLLNEDVRGMRWRPFIP